MGKLSPAMINGGPIRTPTSEANGFRQSADVWRDEALRDARRMGPKHSARLISPVRDVKNFRIRVRSM